MQRKFFGTSERRGSEVDPPRWRTSFLSAIPVSAKGACRSGLLLMVSVEIQSLEEALVCFVCLLGVASVQVNAADAAIDLARARRSTRPSVGAGTPSFRGRRQGVQRMQA